jgi:hypothetical protein
MRSELLNNVAKDCVRYDMGKLYQHPANFFEAKRTYKAGSKLHGDINVFPTQTTNGFKYALIFTDETSRFSWLFLLKTREGLAVHIINLTKLIFTQNKTKVQVIKTDNEFISNAIT